MSQDEKRKAPKIGFITMTLPGYLLGEELAPAKDREAIEALEARGYTVVAKGCVESREAAAKAGLELAGTDIDLLCVMTATFIPDYFITELARQCEKPLFLWALEREVFCLSTVCLPLITASLYNLDRDCCAVSGDIGEEHVFLKLADYAKAACLKRRLHGARIGYTGFKPPIMYSMESNEYLLDRCFGVSVYPIPAEEFYEAFRDIPEKAAKDSWDEIRQRAGKICAAEKDGLESARYYLAARSLADRYGLSGLSMNCFPALKARICLAVALLNDDGIAAGCEGDINSTVLMAVSNILSDKAPFNGDFLKTYPDRNAVLFSHCGAGAFSLAGSQDDICLKCSAETDDGLAVFYETCLDEPVTLCNMVVGKECMRVSVMTGMPIEDHSGYEGTPLTVQFGRSVLDLPDEIAQCGAGHHWVGIAGKVAEPLRLFARMNRFTVSELMKG